MSAPVKSSPSGTVEEQPSAAQRYGWLAWRMVRPFLVAYLVVLLMLMILENSLTYVPTKHPQGDWQPPGLKFEDAEFASTDGTPLHGWFSEVADPLAVVLFCHGNAGNVTHRAEVIAALNKMQATVLVFDYRGYGKSGGSPHEAGVLADARAARKWLAERASLPETEIVLMGESLGGGVAVHLAAHDGARGLVLEDTFTSLPDAAAIHYPWLPVRLLMRGKLNSLASIANYRGPLLMSHGDADSIVPYRLGQQLFAAANEPKQFLTHDGADHNAERSLEFYEALNQFLRKLPQNTGTGAPARNGQ
ncbi:MAG TPA: alpha/beta hydrolase [Pirellulaceae bacterium]|nr:alpha/beta hydrolase [Pirellulaceae bacterium]